MQLYEDDNRLKRFLLGDVTSEEEAQLEDRLFDDSDFVRQLAVIEEELIDDYLCGRLTDDERTRFERHFMTPRQAPGESDRTGARHEQLLMIKALKRYAANPKRRSTVRYAMRMGENWLDFRHWRRALSTRISLFGVAWRLAAVMLSSIGLLQVCSMLGQELSMPPLSSHGDIETLLTQIEHEREQRAQADARAQALQTQLKELQKARQNVPINELLSRAEIEKRESSSDLQRLRPEFNPYRARFSIPSTKPFWLKLDIHEHDRFPEYSIELIDEQGKIVAKKRGLRLVDSEYLSFALSSSGMQTGEYSLLLYGRRGELKQKLGEYEMYVRVTR